MIKKVLRYLYDLLIALPTLLIVLTVVLVITALCGHFKETIKELIRRLEENK